MTTKRRGGLGRGLDALLEPAEPGVLSVPLDQLEPNRLQPRSDFADDALEELAMSIRQQGIVQPIVVTEASDNRYSIVAGERRWRAAQRAGLSQVPIVVRRLESEHQRLEMALVENLQRADLNPVEEAQAYRSLQDGFGMSQEDIGHKVGKSRASISHILRLLSLQPEIQSMLRERRLSAGQARPLLALDSPQERLELAQKAIREGLSARQIEAIVRGEKKPRPRRKTQKQDADTAAAAERLTQKLQTKVEIKRRGKGGDVRIHFHSEEELMRLYDLLVGDEGGY